MARGPIPQPPKKASKIPLTLRLKRKTYTIFVSIASDATVLQLKKELCEMVNGTGGLVVDAVPEIMDDEDLGGDDVDIPIPKPSFATGSDDSDAEETAEIKGEIPAESQVKGLVIQPKDVKLAVPKDKSNIHEGAIEDITDEKETLSSFSLEDNDVVLFALKDEDYDVFEPIDYRNEE